MKKTNRNGSALLWTIAIIMVLEVTVAAALGISYSYYHRSVANHEKRQAYVTAKGVLQNIVNNINSGTEEYLELIKDIENGESRSLMIDLPLERNAGIIEDAFVKLETMKVNDYDRDILTVSVLANYDGYKKRINADMQLGKIQGVPTWQLLKYYEEDYVQLDIKNVRNAKYYLSIADTMYKAWPNGMVFKDGLKSWKEALIQDYPDEYTEFNKWFNNNDAVFQNRRANDTWRPFFYYMGKPNGYIEFDKKEAKNQDLVAMLEKKFPEKLYIQPFFPLQNNPQSTLCIIYANPATTVTGNWTQVLLFYNEDEGHWHYTGDTIFRKGDVVLYDENTETGKKKADTKNVHQYNGSIEPIDMTMFHSYPSNDPDILKVGNTPEEIWKRFKKVCLTPENRID